MVFYACFPRLLRWGAGCVVLGVSLNGVSFSSIIYFSTALTAGRAVLDEQAER